MPGILQRGRDAIKQRLDRRYERRELADETRAQVHLAMDGLVETLADLSRRLDSIETETRELRADLALVRRSVEDGRRRTETSLAALSETLDRLARETRHAAAFVGDEDPTELRKRVFEAHRLAREGAHAIESLLQEEVLIKRDLAARSEP